MRAPPSCPSNRSPVYTRAHPSDQHISSDNRNFLRASARSSLGESDMDSEREGNFRRFGEGIRELWRDYRDRFFGVPHRALAAVLAILARCVLLIARARADPPMRPSSIAALLLPSSGFVSSSISPVAIRMTWTALLMTSAGRFRPFRSFGMNTGYGNVVSALVAMSVVRSGEARHHRSVTDD